MIRGGVAEVGMLGLEEPWKILSQASDMISDLRGLLRLLRERWVDWRGTRTCKD